MKKNRKERGTLTGFSLSNYIKILVQQEACDWTGKREAELRVAETEMVGGGWGDRRGEEAIWRTNRMIHVPRGFK